VLGLALFSAMVFGSPTYALDVSDIIGVIGGGFLVETIAGPLNDFINTITLNKGVASEDMTKVVPDSFRRAGHKNRCRPRSQGQNLL